MTTRNRGNTRRLCGILGRRVIPGVVQRVGETHPRSIGESVCHVVSCFIVGVATAVVGVCRLSCVDEATSGG